MFLCVLLSDGGGIVVCSSPRYGNVVDVASILALTLFGALQYEADAAAAVTLRRCVCPCAQVG